jgi:predicted DNA-binding transcriptional regulator AlpA
MDMDRVVRRKQLLELIGVSTVTQWRMEKAGLFPARFRLGKGLVGWHLTEVEEWLRNRDRVPAQVVERKTVRRAADRAFLSGGPVSLSNPDASASAATPDRRTGPGGGGREKG